MKSRPGPHAPPLNSTLTIIETNEDIAYHNTLLSSINYLLDKPLKN
jgi:hypothetical protein